MSTGQGQRRERDRPGNEMQPADSLLLYGLSVKGKRIEQLEDQLQFSEHRQGSVFSSFFFASLPNLFLSLSLNKDKFNCSMSTSNTSKVKSIEETNLFIPLFFLVRNLFSIRKGLSKKSFSVDSQQGERERTEETSRGLSWSSTLICVTLSL